MYVIAHLSDPHLDGSERNRERFRHVAGYLRGMTSPPDVIVLTGDIVQGDALPDYLFARDTLAGIAPVLPCPGNSDTRRALRDAFPRAANDPGAGDPGDGPVNLCRPVGPVTIVMLDSSVPGAFHGELSGETRQWLTARLASIPPTMPVVIGMHHPPIALGHPAIDALGLRDPAALAEILDAHPNVVAVLVGHSHGATATTFAGRPVVVAPGIHSGSRLPWEGTEGLLDEAAPPSLAIHLLHDDHRLTTHFRAVSPDGEP